MGLVVYRVYQGLIWLIFAVVLVQFFLAGIGIFGEESMGEEAIMPHVIAGLLTVPAGLLLVLIGIVATFTGNLSGRRLGMTVLLFVLLFAQFFLGGPAQDISPYLAAFHPVNALLLLGLSFHLARSQKTAAPNVAESRVQ